MRGVIRILLAGTALVSLAVSAQAQGFAVRSQSTIAVGMALAGTAAGSASISSQYWNPATLGLVRRTTTESNFTLVAPNSKVTPTTATTPLPGVNLLARGDSDDQANDALVPASYAAMRINERLVLGFSFNSPFGLGVKPNENWAGQFYSFSSKLKTYQGTISAAFDVLNNVTIGAGVQVMHTHASLKSGIPTLAGLPMANGFPVGEFSGSGTGVGGTLGILWKPMPGTEIGLGWRSAITTSLDGDWRFPGALSLAGALAAYESSGHTNLTTPDFVTLGISHRLTSNLKLLGTVEWANWSRLRNLPVTYDVGRQLPGSPATLPFYYEDSWFYSLGLEYQMTDALALRTGVGYNTSPVPDSSRNLRVPDNDRIWASAGLTYVWNDRISVNAGYTHIWVDEAPIAVGPGNPTYNPSSGTFFGEADSHIHIASVGLTVRWGDPPAPAVVKK